MNLWLASGARGIVYKNKAILLTHRLVNSSDHVEEASQQVHEEEDREDGRER